MSDAGARARIAQELERSLVVVAGAGTGKTSALVGRVVGLVRDERVPLREIAVITFTEAAAAELRARLRAAVAQASAAAPDDEALAGAAAELDEAAICTLHAFAQRILVEHALAAGVPPDFDVLDTVAEQAVVEQAVTEFVDRLLDDRAAEPYLLRGLLLGLGQQEILQVAWCLHANWDRLDEGAMEAIEQARRARPLAPCPLGPVVAAIDEALALQGRCTDPDDRLLAHLRGRVQEARAALVAAEGDEAASVSVLARMAPLTSNLGQKDNWQGDAAEVREACGAAEQARQQALAEAQAPVVLELLARLARFTLDHAAARAAEGRLSFHDLLVHARRILRHDAAARAALRRRYRRLLIDEFQDTDPLQVELAAWLASAVEGTGDLAAARPGALFVVGDPRQSIYRFRRADIALFEQVCAEVGEEVHLDTNFRSVPGILGFVNAVFTDLFGAGALSGQAVHHHLHPARQPLPGTLRAGTGVQLQLAGLGTTEEEPPSLSLPPVVLLGGPVEGSVGDARRAGARHAAATIRRAVEEGWVVADPRDASRLRSARWADVAVLIPTRTSLPPLEEALDEAGVPYRLEGAALLWGSDDVRDVLCALAAAEEPSDAVSVLAAVRTAGLGCGDDDLVDWHASGGSWDPRAEAPASLAGHPVARALAVLAELHRLRWWHEPSELVRMTIERLRALPLACAERRPRDHWHRLRWLADQARLFDETVGGTLHDFLRWAEIQRAGDGRASVLGPPEPDDDAVRVMTVHGAKGLEFPVVVVSGLERDDGAGQRPDAVLWTDGPVPEVRAGMFLRSAGYEAAAERDRFLDRLERVRLLYVAMTRARDHLVLCLHHKARNGSAADTVPAVQLADIARTHPLLWRGLAEPEAEKEAETAPPRRRRVAARALEARGRPGEPEVEEDWPTTLTRWAAGREELVRRRRRLAVVTASGLAAAGEGTATGSATGLAAVTAGASAPASDPGWAEPEPVTGRSGDVGLDIGRAVHGALAVLDLAAGTDAEGRPAAEVARSRAAAHGLGTEGAEGAEADAVETMVRAALASDVVRAAAARRHHKEMYVAVAPGGPHDGVFEGFVDLLVEDEDGLVVVDYKTDRLAGEGAEADARRRYGRQVAAYADAVEAASGRAVVRGVLLFLGDGTARVVVLQGDELAAARDDARRLAASLLSASAP